MPDRGAQRRLEDLQEETRQLADEIYLNNPSLSGYLSGMCEDFDEAIEMARRDDSLDGETTTRSIWNPRRWF